MATERGPDVDAEVVTDGGGGKVPFKGTPYFESGGKYGRPSKLNQGVQDRICAIIEQTGCSLDGAAAVCGISHDCLMHWKKRMKPGVEDCPYRRFYEAVSIAQKKAEPPLAAIMARAARSGDWRAAHAVLKSRFPETWGDQITIVKKFADMSDEELDAYLNTQLTRISESEFGEDGLEIEGEDWESTLGSGGGIGPEGEGGAGPPALPAGTDREDPE